MISIRPLREEALAAGFAAMRARLPAEFTFDEFRSRLADWRVDAFHDGERAVGMLMVKGAELHVAVIPEVRGRWLSRRLIRETFAPILAEHRQAKTSVLPDNSIGLDFVRRIRAGFADLTFDPGAALGAGASILGGAIQGSSAKKAAKQAAAAQDRATEAQLQMFNTVNQQQGPYRQSGYNALNAINAGFGFGPVNTGAGGASAPALSAPNRADFTRMPQNYEAPVTYVDQWIQEHAGIPIPGSTFDQAGYDSALNAYQQQQQQAQAAPAAATGPVGGIQPGYFAHQFNAGDLNANMAPNWKFALDQGIGATKNAANLQTGLLSGNTMKGIADYTLNKSGDLYQSAYNNYTTNQSNIYNRLSTLAGLGSAANQQSAGLAGSIAPGVASSLAGAGAAQAAGTVGQASAISGGLNNALGWYQASRMTQPQTGSAGTNPWGEGWSEGFTW